MRSLRDEQELQALFDANPIEEPIERVITDVSLFEFAFEFANGEIVWRFNAP